MNHHSFVYTSHPARVLFGQPALEVLRAEALKLGQRALVLSTPEQAALGEQAVAALGPTAVGLFSGAAMHVPVDGVDRAEQVVTALGPDMTVAIGGGSTIGLAKALSLRCGLPSLVVPTTYAGSEMTPIWGLTDARGKTTGRDLAVLPRTVIYDPALTLTLPQDVSAASGLNAIAHCVEALYAKDSNPIIALMAAEGIRTLGQGLRCIMIDPHDLTARADALVGAWLGGTVLGLASMALHHKLCHVLGGLYNLPHAQTHAAVLPHALHYNAAAAPDAARTVALALGHSSGPGALYDLAAEFKLLVALRDLGMPESGIETVVSATLASPYPNPAPLEADGLRTLLRRAYSGERPPA